LKYKRRIWTLLAGVGLVVGCGDSGTTTGSDTTSGSMASGMGGTGVGSTSGNTTNGATSSSGMMASSSSGMGGMGGGMPAIYGPSTSQFVNSGNKHQSLHFRLINTFGQPTQNQTTSQSSGFRMQGGLVGNMESLP
jgi:hypothetical protein